MDKQTLKPQLVNEGLALVSKLEELGYTIEAAFWFYDSQKSASWKLLIGSSSKDLDVSNDAIAAYKTLSEIIQKNPKFSYLSPSDIQLIPLNHPIIGNISSVFTINSGEAVSYFTDTLINNIFFEGLVLYRMNLNKK